MLFNAFATSTGAVQGNRYISNAGYGTFQDIEFKNSKVYLTYRFGSNLQTVISQFDPASGSFTSHYLSTTFLSKFLKGQVGDR